MTRPIYVGSLCIGGDAPIVVQSMTNTNTRDVDATVTQIRQLEHAGCELVRVAVPDLASAAALTHIRERIGIPLVADIHFDHRIALASIQAGVDKLRLNPGNITDPKKIIEVVEAAAAAKIPIRVGANSGSMAKEYLDKDGHVTAQGMVASAMAQVRLLEAHRFEQIIISLKGTDVPMTLAAYRMMAHEVDYPLHIGITEAGTSWEGGLRSAVGLGVLLEQGIGDTVRVSLTGDPVEEVRVAYAILRALNLRQRGITFRICPTCGRTGIALEKIAIAVQDAVRDLNVRLTVAMMGCVVNGLGEAREADVGLVGATGRATIYVHGEPAAVNVAEAELIERMVSTIRDLAGGNQP
ncbi:flavodoxin-dependent (E)-4-hydroxy-3-methylbut-2-enyl-diphosphate synthase [Candidatus Bipolaricaulota bacterium]|nr:flavodoxin-dependent (E)-4-hydroxy-3-methylbut-2-enyl-diphosphate synthase [Candidatus Bipolaricaulota bacterium]